MTSSRRKIHRTLVTAGLLAGLAGCASLPPPANELGAAQAAVTAADTPDDQRYAPEELAAARGDLDAAKAAMSSQDYDRARWLAIATQADADLAHAKGRALAAQSQVAIKTEDNANLRHRLIDQEPLP